MSNLTSEWKKWWVRAEACSSSIWIRDLVSSKRILGRSSPRRSCGRVASWRVIPRRWGRDSTSSGLDWGGGLYWNAKAAGSGLKRPILLRWRSPGQTSTPRHSSCPKDSRRGKRKIPPIPTTAIYFSCRLLGHSSGKYTAIGLWSSIYQGDYDGPPRSVCNATLIWVLRAVRRESVRQRTYVNIWTWKNTST